MGTRSLPVMLALLAGACVLPALPATAGAQPVLATGGANNIQMYLVLPGGNLNGSAKVAVANNPDIIELTGFSLSAVTKTGPASFTGKSLAVGLPTLDVTATMRITPTTVGLLENMFGGKPFTTLEVDFRKEATGGPQSNPYTFVKYLFTRVALTSYSLQDGPDGDSVQIGLVFAKFAETYYTKNAQTGAISSSAGNSWDLTTAQKS